MRPTLGRRKLLLMISVFFGAGHLLLSVLSFQTRHSSNSSSGSSSRDGDGEDYHGDVLEEEGMEDAVSAARRATVRQLGQAGDASVRQPLAVQQPRPLTHAPNHHREESISVEQQGEAPCPDLQPPPLSLPDLQQWQPVVPAKSYVFSAFFDVRPESAVVRVIGLSDTRTDGRPEYCRLWYPGRSQPVLVHVRDDIVPETHDKRFAAFVYQCPVIQNEVPYAVSMVIHCCHASHNVLPVQHVGLRLHDWNYSPSTKFIVCVPPLHTGYNDARQLVENIEVNRLFGAEKFVFYNYSVGSIVGDYLHHYIDAGLSHVIRWNIPPEAVREVHYVGQLAAINDCLYRHMYQAKYLVFTDLDELIVPRSPSSWESLVNSIPTHPTGTRPCSFVFQNVFFRTSLPSDSMRHSNTSIIHKYNIRTLLQTYREEKPWPYGFRSKYIADPSRVEIAGVHFVWKPLGVKYEFQVPSNQSLLHHYRAWEGNEGYTQDLFMNKHKHVIINTIMKRHTLFSSISRYKSHSLL